MRGAVQIEDTPSGHHSPGLFEDPLAGHLSVLRGYARRAIVEERRLTDAQRLEKEQRFDKFIELCGFYKMSEREMVSLLFRGVLNNSSKCWCSRCREAFEQDPGPPE